MILQLTKEMKRVKKRALKVMVLVLSFVIAFTGCGGGGSSGGYNPPPQYPENPVEPENPVKPTNPLPVVQPEEANVKITIKNIAGPVEFPCPPGHYENRGMGRETWLELVVYETAKMYSVDYEPYRGAKVFTTDAEYHLQLSPGIEYTIKAYVYKVLLVSIDQVTYKIKVIPLAGQGDITITGGKMENLEIELEKFSVRNIAAGSAEVEGGERITMESELYSPVGIHSFDGGHFKFFFYYKKTGGEELLETDDDAKISEINAKESYPCPISGWTKPVLDDTTYDFWMGYHMGGIQEDLSVFCYIFFPDMAHQIKVTKMEDAGELIIGVN